MNGTEACLAEAGINMYLIIAVTIVVIVITGAILVGRQGRWSLRGILAVPLLCCSLLISSAAPAYASADRCEPSTLGSTVAATALPDMSSGAPGEVQRFNVLANDSPSRGETFVLSSMKLTPVDDPLPGTTVDADAKRLVAPTEGRYAVESDGDIEFAPEMDFRGRARGVHYSIEDTGGKVVTSAYRPMVLTAEVCTDDDTVLLDRTIVTSGYRSDTLRDIPLSGYSYGFAAPGSGGAGLAIQAEGGLFQFNATNGQWTPTATRTGVYEYGLFEMARSTDGSVILSYDYAWNEETMRDGYDIYLSKDYNLTRERIISNEAKQPWEGAISEDGSVIAIRFNDQVAGPNTDLAYSANSGATWSTVTAPGDGKERSINRVFSVSGDGGTLVVSADSTNYTDDNIVSVTQDGGATWSSRLMDINEHGDVSMSNNGQEIAITASGGGIMITTDTGDNWIASAGGSVANEPVVKVHVLPEGGKILSLAQQESFYDDAKLYSSTDGGTSWQFIGVVPTSMYLNGEVIGDGTTLYMYKSWEDEIPYSTDGGQTWKMVSMRYQQDFDPSRVDMDPATPGQQLSVELADEYGSVFSYDPEMDEFYIDSDIEREGDVWTSPPIPYTVTGDNGCQAKPATIVYKFYRGGT